MTEDDLRALVRQAVARHLDGVGRRRRKRRQSGRARAWRPPELRTLPAAARAAATSGACLIEPAVKCNHCGFCLSARLLSRRPPYPMPKPKVLVTRLLPEKPLDLLREHCTVDLYDKHDPMPRELLMDKVAKVDAVICLLTDGMDRGVIEKCYSVRAICDVSVGYNNIDIAAARERGDLGHAHARRADRRHRRSRLGADPGATRRVAEGDRLIREGGWTGFRSTSCSAATWPASARDHRHGPDRPGRRAGARGLRHGGRYVPTPASASGRCRVRRRLRATPMPFDELLRTSDVVSLHCPLTPETHHLIDTRALSLMKPTAYLVNMARGPVVDEAALAKALRDGRIAGAGLDVFENEPTVHAELLELENVAAAAAHRQRDGRDADGDGPARRRQLPGRAAGAPPPTPVPELTDLPIYS